MGSSLYHRLEGKSAEDALVERIGATFNLAPIFARTYFEEMRRLFAEHLRLPDKAGRLLLHALAAEGTVDGEPFYFRSRGARWAIEIGPGYTGRVVEAMERTKTGTGGPPSWEAASALSCWRYEEPYGVFPEAGYVTEEETRGFILRAARLWSASRKSG